MKKPSHAGGTGQADPIALQVFQQRLIGIVREMRATMIHSAFSAAICELYDLSCAILSAKGELVVQSEDNPQHIFPLLWSAQEIIRQYGEDIHPDDVFLHNDPYEGGTHLNDIAVIVPFSISDIFAVPPPISTFSTVLFSSAESATAPQPCAANSAS